MRERDTEDMRERDRETERVKVILSQSYSSPFFIFSNFKMCVYSYHILVYLISIPKTKDKDI